MTEELSTWRDTDSRYQHRVLREMIDRMNSLFKEADEMLTRGSKRGVIVEMLEECAALGAAIAVLEEIADVDPSVLQ